MICPACAYVFTGWQGRPRKLTGEQLAAAVVRIDAGARLVDVARDLSVSRATLYRRVREWRAGAA